MCMENIVAVAVDLASGESRYFLTWGRIQDPVNSEPLEKLILDVSGGFSLRGTALAARLCGSLQEAAAAPYFFECFFEMSQRVIPFGEQTYPKWQAEMDRLMRMGKEVWYLG